MVVFEDKKKEMAAFRSDPLEDLTIQDGLIISAVYAVNAETDKCEQISELAQKHPLFVEEPAATSARVNKFTNLMQSGKSLQAVEAAARALRPEQRQQAFEFAMEAALADGLLTSKKKNTLQALANKLELDNAFGGQKLANI
jgi:hypothetical protein